VSCISLTDRLASVVSLYSTTLISENEQNRKPLPNATRSALIIENKLTAHHFSRLPHVILQLPPISIIAQILDNHAIIRPVILILIPIARAHIPHRIMMMMTLLRVRLMAPPRIAAPVIIPTPLMITFAALRAGPPLILAVPLLVLLLAQMMMLARAATMLGSLNLDFL
jgi:hypothetical protein